MVLAVPQFDQCKTYKCQAGPSNYKHMFGGEQKVGICPLYTSVNLQVWLPQQLGMKVHIGKTSKTAN